MNIGASPVSLGQTFDPGRNAIGFLRLALASMVLISHAFPIGGFGTDPLMWVTGDQQDAGSLAVDGFFVLSGFLITDSFLRLGSSTRFLWHRALRILPGYWVCLAVTAFGFGATWFLLERGTMAGFISQPNGPLAFVASNAALNYQDSTIGALLSGVALPGGVNGSLWTLGPEFACYLGLLAIGVVGVLRRQRWFVAAVVAVLLFGWATTVGMPEAYRDQIRWPLFFGLGAAAYLYRDRIPLDGRIAAIALVGLGLAVTTGSWAAIFPVPLAYVVLVLAVRLPFVGVGRRVDISYGMYLYAWPVAQTAALAGIQHLGLAPYLTVVIAATALLAVTSWHVVERPMLTLKAWPRRLEARPLPAPDRAPSLAP